MNCGYGHGSSVREVIASVERLTGRPLPVKESPRRSGDPPWLVADARKIKQVLGWTPAYDDLDEIVRTALAWEQKLNSSV
jgi:UDP-glucose 4-epimerase